MSGTYHQNSGGALNIAIGGLTAGIKYDQLNVTGAATVNGTLNLSLINGFIPAVGSTFEILNASSVSGTFSTVTGMQINGSEHFVVACDTTDCDVTVVSGAASTSAATMAVQRLAVSSGPGKSTNAVVRMTRYRDFGILAGGFHGHQHRTFRLRDFTAFTHQPAQPRSTPSVNFSALILARTERPSQLA